MTRIDDTFARLRAEGKKAFVSYITVSYTHLTLPTSDLV